MGVNGYEKLNTIFLEIMQTTWDYYKDFLKPVLDTLEKELSEVAYLNTFKWRWCAKLSEKNRKILYDLAWEKHTKAQIGLLKPGGIVVLGKGLHGWFTSKRIGTDRFGISRGRLSLAEAKANLERIQEYAKKWRSLEADTGLGGTSGTGSA